MIVGVQIMVVDMKTWLMGCDGFQTKFGGEREISNGGDERHDVSLYMRFFSPKCLDAERSSTNSRTSSERSRTSSIA